MPWLTLIRVYKNYDNVVHVVMQLYRLYTAMLTLVKLCCYSWTTCTHNFACIWYILRSDNKLCNQDHIRSFGSFFCTFLDHIIYRSSKNKITLRLSDRAITMMTIMTVLLEQALLYMMMVSTFLLLMQWTWLTILIYTPLRMTRFSTNACITKVKHNYFRVPMNDHVLQDASLVSARD